MKKFNFSLQKLLELRQFSEDEAKTELAKAISEYDKINAELTTIAQKYVKVLKEKDGCTDINILSSIEQFVGRLKLRKEELLTDLAQAQLVIEEKRKSFAEAMKNRKVISKLEEKQYSDYRKDFYKKEESEIDDITSSKYISEE